MVLTEVFKYNHAFVFDENINSKLVKKNKNTIRADKVKVGDIIELECNDITPAILKTLKIDTIHSSITESKYTDFDVGFYDDKESTGEEISKPFYIGDIIPPHRKMVRPFSSITAKVIDYVDVIQYNHKMINPLFLNNARFVMDLFAIIFLLILSFSVSASAVKYSNMSFSIMMNHLIAMGIAGNILIPSMRMTLLYNVYNLLLSYAFKTIKVNSYESLEKLDNIETVIFDKTGTLTEEHLSVHSHYIFENHPIFKKLKELGWQENEICFAIMMSNSESNENEEHDNTCWGTSPEENKMLNYWLQNGIKLIFNPVKSSGTIIFKYNDNPERKIIIKNRQAFNFEFGKLSHITIVNNTEHLDLIVRQHGTSRFIDEYAKNTSKSVEQLWTSIDDCYNWAIQIITMDKHRAISIGTYNKNEITNKDEWEILSIYTFDNPLRKNVNCVIDYFNKNNIPVNILTGDSRDTAEDIAKIIGFADIATNIKTYNDIQKILKDSLAIKQTISIEGCILENLLKENNDLMQKFLNNRSICKVIYKANKKTKETIVFNTRNCLYTGDAKNDELAIKNAYVGIALNHGAETCKLYSSITIEQPMDLIDLMITNGYKDMLLTGGQQLFKDVCFFGGLICGCLIVGIHYNKFEFLNGSYLYKDVWNPLSMLMISSIEYTLSSIAYASSNCTKKRNSSFVLIMLSMLNKICGFSIGICVGWIIKNYLLIFNYNKLIIHAINIIILLKHSLHCLNFNKTGTQIISNSNGIVGFILNIIDSLQFRIILYLFFCLINM
jgi:magnesium-transporting ATPase (P-type)